MEASVLQELNDPPKRSVASMTEALVISYVKETPLQGQRNWLDSYICVALVGNGPKIPLLLVKVHSLAICIGLDNKKIARILHVWIYKFDMIRINCHLQQPKVLFLIPHLDHPEY